jgi:hypothetical protein
MKTVGLNNTLLRKIISKYVETSCYRCQDNYVVKAKKTSIGKNHTSSHYSVILGVKGEPG